MRIASTRRQLLRAGVVAAVAPVAWRAALAPAARAADSAYGPLQPADANGLMLPPGFTSRVIARGGELVARYRWHLNSDGQAVFPGADGGWILVSNSESLAAAGGGSSAIRFGPDGAIRGAYRILAGTNANCSGGATPWGTWLSCEEFAEGFVWECNPRKPGQGVMRPAMGAFAHESVAADRSRWWFYMTEDRSDGGLYRFRPDVWRDLTAGRLQIAARTRDPGVVRWLDVPDPTGTVLGPTRYQVRPALHFDGGEGCWFDSGRLYFSTKGDDRIRALEVRTGRLETIYDGASDGPLRGVDNLTVSRAGEIFVCEDGGDMEICVIGADRTVAPFLRVAGPAAQGTLERGNELAGVVFNPAGSRMYFAAQRAFGVGAIYEVSGPFLGEAVAAPTAAAASAPVRRRRLARVRVGRWRRGAVRVRVRTRRGADVMVALRTDDLATVAGARGSTARPETVVLARARRRAVGGRVSVRLDAGHRGPVRAMVVVSARIRAGSVEVAARRVEIGR
jgi:hypothetical protein